MVAEAEESQRAHADLPSPNPQAVQCFRTDGRLDAMLARSVPLLGQPMDGWEKGGAENSVGERESGRRRGRFSAGANGHGAARAVGGQQAKRLRRSMRMRQTRTCSRARGLGRGVSSW